jgi:phenylalanyl-tRNA synthetase beta chain
MIGQYLNGCGFYETVNVSFVDDKLANAFGMAPSNEHLAIKDVSRKSANLLRSSLLGSLVSVVKVNTNAGNKPVRLFEIANTFIPSRKSLPEEGAKLAIVCDSDMRDLRGAVEGVVECLAKKSSITFGSFDVAWAEAGARICVNGQPIGMAGVLSDEVKAKFDLEGINICAAELDYNRLEQMQSDAVTFEPLSRFPAIGRDLSLLLDESVTWESITAAIEKAKCDKLEQTKFVGIYRGKGIEAGKKSLTLTLRFRDEDGTLTHEQVDGFEEKIVSKITKATDAVLRTA